MHGTTFYFITMTTDLSTAKQFHAFLKEIGKFDEFRKRYKESDWRKRFKPLSSSHPSDLVLRAFYWEYISTRWDIISQQWRGRLRDTEAK